MSKQDKIIETICRERVIAAIADLQNVVVAMESEVQTVFLLHADIGELERAVHVLRAHGKNVFIHFDMVEGLASTPAGLELLATLFPFDGVITTKGSIIQKGKRLGLVTIQRVFMIDSRSISTALGAVEKFKPDAIELMPGLLPKVVQSIHDHVDPLIITGGMLSTPEEVEMMLATPAVAISASATALWTPAPGGCGHTNRAA